MPQSDLITDPEQLIRRRSLCRVLREALVYEADESRSPSGKGRDREGNKISQPKHTHINTRAEQCNAITWCRLTISWSASVWVAGFSGSERGLSWDAYYKELRGWVGVYMCVCVCVCVCVEE